MNLIKPCPFCGGKAEEWSNSGDERFPQEFYIGCKSCDIYFCEWGSSSWQSSTKIDNLAKQSIRFKWERRA